MIPCGSRRQREGCFKTPSRDALQSIQSADLVVAALEHPTPNGHPTPNTQRPATQHPTPNGRPPNTQHPSNTQRPKRNLHGSLRQREGCFRTTYRGASQSIPSGDLVVAAAGRGIQRPPSKCYQSKEAHPGVTLPSRQRSKNPRLPPAPAVPPAQASLPKPPCQSLTPRPGVTLPSAWNRK